MKNQYYIIEENQQKGATLLVKLVHSSNMRARSAAKWLAKIADCGLKRSVYISPLAAASSQSPC